MNDIRKFMEKSSIAALERMSDIRKFMEKSSIAALERIEYNKHILFDFLDSKEIEYATVSFDGSSDSGNVDDVSYYKENKRTSCPQDALENVKIFHGQVFSPDGFFDDVKVEKATPQSILEIISYDALMAKHRGWENGSGARGEFYFDCSNREISLEFYQKSEELFEHVF